MKKDKLFRHIWQKHFHLWLYALVDESDNLYRLKIYDEKNPILVGRNVIGRLLTIEKNGGGFFKIDNNIQAFMRKLPKQAKIGDLLPLSIDRHLPNDKGLRVVHGWQWKTRYAYLTTHTATGKSDTKDDSWQEALLLCNLENEKHHLTLLPHLRYVKEAHQAEALSATYAHLSALWHEANQLLQNPNCQPQILPEADILQKALLDMPNIKAPILFDGSLQGVAKASLQTLAPDLCDDIQANDESLAMTSHWQALLDNPIIFGEGGEIFVDETEAATIIDIDTAKDIISKGGGENGILQFNLNTAEEIMRLIGAMNLAGIILVDFIRLKNPHNRRLLTDRLKVLSKRLALPCDILGYSRSGFIEILRRRSSDSLRKSYHQLHSALVGLSIASRHYKRGTIYLTASSDTVALLQSDYNEVITSLPIEFIIDDSILFAIVETR